MDIDDFLRIARAGIETAVLISAPVLVLGLIAGLAVSIFQAATQINDAALAFIPKIAASVVGLIVFGHFMINKIAEFTTTVYTTISTLSP